MNCPKCNAEINDKMLVCPSCKKVLQLLCPKCNTINKSNTCKKCGFSIVTKCHQCGKIAQTNNGKCKCGFSTYQSVAINTSNTDDFACLTVEFPNIEDVKSILGSTKLFEKFKVNLDKTISEYATSKELLREIIDGTYVIKFNKDYSFATSASNAMKSAIELLNLIMELNFKLNKAKNVTLQCNVAVLKRGITSLPEDYKSGFDVKLIYQNSKELKLLNSMQLITDSGVYESVNNEYNLATLSSAMVNGRQVMFFELKLKKYVKIPKEKPPEEVDETLKLPAFAEEPEEEEKQEEDIYDIESINFEELRCNFVKTKSANLTHEVISAIKRDSKHLISIKCDNKFVPKTGKLIEAIANTKAYNDICQITCTDEMKFKPYGFFNDLLSSFCNYSQSTKNSQSHNFDVFSEIDPSGYLRDLINLNKRETANTEEVRTAIFEIFVNIFYSLSKTLIYIENFEKIDGVSLEILQFIFTKFDELDVSYLIVGEGHSLHKNTHSLLAKSNYSEITQEESKFTEIIEQDIQKFKPILESHYIQKIAKHTKGSILYFEHVIDYLLECELIELQDNAFEITTFENILIPTNLNDLISKRLKHLAKDKDTHKILGQLLLIGPRVDTATIRLLEIKPNSEEFQNLIKKNYIYILNDTIHINNYNLVREIFLNATVQTTKHSYATEVLEKAYSSESVSPIETTLYKILGQEKNEFLTWEKLSELNMSMGDFDAYMNCSLKFLKLLANNIDEDSQKSIEEYKSEIYGNIAALLYKYTPDKMKDLTEIIMDSLEKSTEPVQVANLCLKMLQGCLSSGDYAQALRMSHQILSKFRHSSINPASESFNSAFFLINLVKLEILFSIGALKDCIESGDSLLAAFEGHEISEIKPEHLSVEQFSEVAYNAMCFVAISRIIMLKPDLVPFLAKFQRRLGETHNIFDLFLLFEKTIHLNITKDTGIGVDNDKFSGIIFNLIKAGNEREDYTKFAKAVYQAKSSAREHNLIQIELLCDLLIGYSYFKLNEHKKAAYMYNSILANGSENGLKLVTYLALYFTALQKYEQNEINVALGIANNASIQLEKDGNSSELLLYLFKDLLSKIFTAKDEPEKAQMCLSHAIFLKEKHGLGNNNIEEQE